VTTTNGGTNWTKRSSGTTEELYDVSFTDADNGIVVGNEGTILRTTNGGNSWTVQISGTKRSLVSVSYTDSENGTAVGKGGTILRTTNGGVTFIQNKPTETPESFILMQNYPNPFNPKTTISYQLPALCQVDLSIYTILGQKIKSLVSEKQVTGNYNVEWDATGFASGIYFYSLKTDKGFVQSKKLILLK